MPSFRNVCYSAFLIYRLTITKPKIGRGRTFGDGTNSYVSITKANFLLWLDLEKDGFRQVYLTKKRILRVCKICFHCSGTFYVIHIAKLGVWIYFEFFT